MDDVLILGAGVIGLSLAYELSGHGARVRLIDRGIPAQEASWAGAGILPPAADDPQADSYHRLSALSYQLHAQWAKQLQDETGIDNGYRRCGGLYVAADTCEISTLEALADHYRGQGFRCDSLDAQALREVQPALCDAAQTGRLRQVYHVPDEAQIRNPWHLQALTISCQQRGVTIESNCTALDFQFDGDRIAAIETDSGTITAGQVIVTAGAWTAALAGRLGIELALRPIRGQIALLRSNRPVLTSVVNRGPRYLVPRQDGRVLIGSTEEDVGFDKRTTAGAITDLLEMAFDLAPELRRQELERSWAGLRPSTADGLPFVGQVPGLENAYLAAGHFRAGLGLSTGTAVVLSQLMRGEAPSIDLEPLRLDRAARHANA